MRCQGSLCPLGRVASQREVTDPSKGEGEGEGGAWWGAVGQPGVSIRVRGMVGAGGTVAALEKV